MKEIGLTKGTVALVDDEDFERISALEWHVLRSGDNTYAVRTETVGEKRVNVLMHRFILGVEDPKIYVDHKFGDGLDNRKSNLRIATKNQNMRNLTRKRANNSSGYRGVSLDKETNKWLAYLYVNGKQKKLGRFSLKEDAARAFDTAAKEHFGEFCGRLNFK